MAIIVISEHIEPARPERKLIAPPWALEGPARAIVMELDPEGMLYRHQSIGLEKLSSPDANLVISTGTASGKTLIFQVSTLRREARTPVTTYPPWAADPKDNAGGNQATAEPHRQH